KVIKDALDDFKDASGLNPSRPKSKAYSCNIINYTKLAIFNVLPFEENRLPVKYLSVPLVLSWLIYRDCKELIDKVQNRVNDWKNKSLSIAGRLQLIQYVLSSLHVYWASVFMLPSRVLLDIEQIMLRGGLGIRRLDHFNKALMVSHVWKLLSLKESLWVKWIHIYKLKNRSFWDIPYHGGVLRVLYPTSFHHVTLLELVLTMLPRDGMGKPFSMHNVWDSIRPRDNLVSWCDLVRFHACIMRHAFNMWLILKQRLRTQDCLRSWEIDTDLVVVRPLCETQPDSHEHLFFDCPFSKQVWSRVQQIAGLKGAGPSLASIITHLMPIAKRKSSKSCIEVVECILSNVRLKLLSCRFKKSKDAILFALLWEIPMSNLK
nr:hypothetical protein [Tanacetum cinerariifolium]